MKSYEINIICDADGCDSIETSEPDDLVNAEEQIRIACEEDGWEVQAGTALCPECIERLADCIKNLPKEQL